MIEVSNADRVVFPAVGRTKGDVVRYYERIAARALAHVAGRPLSIRRFPKGLAGPGFFQKNVPKRCPADIERFAVPRRGVDRVTLYPVVRDPEQLVTRRAAGSSSTGFETPRRSGARRIGARARSVRSLSKLAISGGAE